MKYTLYNTSQFSNPKVHIVTFLPYAFMVYSVTLLVHGCVQFLIIEAMLIMETQFHNILTRYKMRDLKFILQINEMLTYFLSCSNV